MYGQRLCSMHQTTMKVLALVCLAIAVLEVASDPCGSQRGQPATSPVIVVPYNTAPQTPNQQTNPAPMPAAAGTMTASTGRRKRNTENDNPPPPPHDHSKEQGKKDQPSSRPRGDTVSIKSKSMHGRVSGQANSASDSASLDHKDMQINNKKSKSNSLKMGMPGLTMFETKSDSNRQSSFNLNSMKGEQKGTSGHTSFEGKKDSHSDSLKLKLRGGMPKLDARSGTALVDLSKSSGAGHAAYGFAGGIGLAKNAAEAGAHGLAGGIDSAKNAAAGKSEVHGKQRLEVHNGLLGNHEGKFLSAHDLALNAGTRGLQGTHVQGASDNSHKTRGSSAGSGNKAGVVATGHNVGKMATGGNLAEKGVSGAAEAASSVAFQGKKQIDMAANAGIAGVGMAKKGVDGVVGAGTDAGNHAMHGLKGAASTLAGSAKNVAGTVNGDVHTNPVHIEHQEGTHGKKGLKNGASDTANLKLKFETN